MLDELLTTPLTTREILRGKCAGCVLGLKSHWLLLIFTWIFAAFCGGLNWKMVLPLLACTAMYAIAFARFGMLCSLVAKTTNRAILASILWSLLLGVPIVLLANGLVATVAYGNSWSDRHYGEMADACPDSRLRSRSCA